MGYWDILVDYKFALLFGRLFLVSVTEGRSPFVANKSLCSGIP